MFVQDQNNELKLWLWNGDQSWVKVWFSDSQKSK